MILPGCSCNTITACGIPLCRCNPAVVQAWVVSLEPTLLLFGIVAFMDLSCRAPCCKLMTYEDQPTNPIIRNPCNGTKRLRLDFGDCRTESRLKLFDLLPGLVEGLQPRHRQVTANGLVLLFFCTRHTREGTVGSHGAPAGSRFEGLFRRRREKPRRAGVTLFAQKGLCCRVVFDQLFGGVFPLNLVGNTAAVLGIDVVFTLDE